MQNTVLEYLSEARHLGVVLSSTLNWNVHINDMLHRAKRRVGILSRLRKDLKYSALRRVYIVYVRPILEYGSNTWLNIGKGLKQDIEKVQKMALRVMLGVDKNTSDLFLYESTGINPLCERRKYLALCSFFKILKTGVPENIYRQIPQWEEQRERRDVTRIRSIKCRIERRRKSFVPMAINWWDSLAKDVRECDDIMVFKRKIRPIVNQKENYFKDTYMY